MLWVKKLIKEDKNLLTNTPLYAILNTEIKKGIDIMKILKVLPYVLAWPFLVVINFVYCGVLGSIESIQDSNKEIQATWKTGKTWKERD